MPGPKGDQLSDTCAIIGASPPKIDKLTFQQMHTAVFLTAVGKSSTTK
eukprot:CAMPEP_0204004762 /NCGR_PEP_ID=MMETSP0360-20130528/18590_1 /ASSEMBLY_ACC=CAM_ASM_000342 /TAXON_ID=268821 /ORGANISM="Scrippsiella Hangoei, Strain SHTV-5" /LENGTH=47 /DNA_ID= /DNA_START= /DNA_END= /DNA_ORIENTATION=